MEPIAISVNGAAKALGVGRSSVYTLLKSGRLDAIKIGRRTLLTTASIISSRSGRSGAAFAQLQGAGMHTAKLSEIVRQTNAATKEAVLASIEDDARKALAALDRGGGKVIAHANPTERMQAMAKDYAALAPKEQRSTIVIDPSRSGRDALNVEIRTQLVASGHHRPCSHPQEHGDSATIFGPSQKPDRDCASPWLPSDGSSDGAGCALGRGAIWQRRDRCGSGHQRLV